jgi:predicted TIM-barrel fold metal-dependent hydrolase
MGMPTGIGIIDLMLNIPGQHSSRWYDFMRPLLLDQESRELFSMPAQYMFKDIPRVEGEADYVAWTVAEMDRHGIAQAMLGFDEDNVATREALERYPQRFFCSYEANPNNAMDEVRKIRRLHREVGIRAVTAFPSGLCPQVPVNDKKWYPIYATLVELDLPFCPCMGVPGPRLPMDPQRVELLDEVCWFFPELRIVTRHGCEPWTELAVKLMLKYPNLYYMTSAFAPRYYPRAIIDFANTRGADKILYAGYFPMGLSLERIFAEMPAVPLRENVWPMFLRDNARRVFRL